MAIRSQSWNTARDLVGWQQFINQFEMEDMYGAFYITPEYTRSFKSCRIARYLFGQDFQNGCLNISGSRVENRGSCDWLADYFGLPTDFKSKVSFRPRVQNFLVDLGMYLGLDNVTEGMYFRIHAPITWTKWELCCGESVTTTGEDDYVMGYMAATTITRDKLASKFFDSMINGCFTFDSSVEKLKYTKINCSCCCQTKTRLSDIQAALGWNFLQDEDYHMGLQILAGFPTGGKRCCEYVFSPVVGNGGHFELGGGLTSSARLWVSDDEEKSCWFYLDANVAHLFKRKLYRTFALKNKPNSRYMLVAEMKTPAENLYVGEAAADQPASTYQFNDKLKPLANISTCCTDVSVAVQGELALKFAWNTGNWSFDLGYNLWGRTGEKVCGACPITKNKYVLKGDAHVYGFGASDQGGTLVNTAIALAPSESGADIHAGTNTVIGTDWVAADQYNPRIDNPKLAYSEADGSDVTHAIMWAPGQAGSTTGQMNSSGDPVFLSCDDLDTCKTPSALSHKIFAHFSYAWKDDMEEEGHTPYLGLGGEAEFAGKTCGNYAALSQWGIWLKGGVAFN